MTEHAAGWPDPNAGVPPQSPTPRRRRGVLIGSAAAVVLVAAGIGSYVAVSSSDSAAGSSSPREAVEAAITDIHNRDLLGLLDDLAPAERTALAQPVGQLISQLKRTKVLAGNADGSSVGGFGFDADDLTWAPKTTVVNDHVQLVGITGGTLHITGNASKVPLSGELLDAVVPGGLHDTSSKTVNIKQELADSGKPAARIATVEVDGRWYPSLFYTVADQAADDRVPASSDPIAATGAATPQAAATTLLGAIENGSGDQLVGIMSPTEMAVLHDYGHALVPSRFTSPFGGTRLSKVTFSSRALSGGRRLLRLTSLTATDGGKTFTVRHDGDCLRTVESGADGATLGLCPGGSTDSTFAQFIEGVSGRPVTQQQLSAFDDLLRGSSNVGLVVGQSGGRWYVEPVGTLLAEVNGLLGGLKSGDLLTIIRTVHP